ncbi:hypothetical protein C8R47DRAFT_996858 [Mycena vitilis]|nr:hypothetical protein C8R47DRAFT_996858 [Mycena vitilis]
MFSTAPVSQYEPLRQSPEATPKECDDNQHKETHRLNRLPCLSHISLILCIVLTLANILITVASQRRFPNPNSPTSIPVTSKNIHLLRRPSQYIRFDEIRRPSPPVPKQFRNYPITLTQIDAAEPDRVLYADKTYMSPIGTVVPADRRISSIIQFRTIDWGMEDCQLHMSVPALGGGDTMGASNISVVLHRLNQTYPLDTAELTFRSRPPRVAKIGDIQLSRVEGTIWSRRFACKADVVLSFELECSGVLADDSCFLEWWQKQGSDPGQ